MPLKKAKNRTFSSKENNVPDANYQVNAPGNASPVLREQEETSQVLESIRNDLSLKITKVLEAIQVVNKEVRDFPSHLDEAEAAH